jgi:hypothetical protein
MRKNPSKKEQSDRKVTQNDSRNSVMVTSPKIRK